MRTNSLKKACQIVGVARLSELLTASIGGVHRQVIYRFIRKGYAPADWFHVIVEATEGRVSFIDLYEDLYVNKRNCNPESVSCQVKAFLSSDYLRKRAAAGRKSTK